MFKITYEGFLFPSFKLYYEITGGISNCNPSQMINRILAMESKYNHIAEIKYDFKRSTKFTKHESETLGEFLQSILTEYKITIKITFNGEDKIKEILKFLNGE